MKNKGRKHIAGLRVGGGNCKGWTFWITRPIESMSSRPGWGIPKGKYIKRKWQKRMRGYLKTQKGKEIFEMVHES